MLPAPKGCDDVLVQAQTCFNQLHLYYMTNSYAKAEKKNMLIGKPCGLQLLKGEITLSHLRTEKKYR